MDKIWHCVIRYQHYRGLASKELMPIWLLHWWESDAPSFSTVQKWAVEFKGGRESLEYDTRSGRTATANTQENIYVFPTLNVNEIANGVLLHQDHAPARKSVFAMAAVRDCDFELVDYLTYILLIWHHLTILFSPQHEKNHSTGKQTMEMQWPSD